MRISSFQSLSRGELEILKDWCTEAVSEVYFDCIKCLSQVYNVLIHPINVSKVSNQKYHLKIIDVGDVEVRIDFCLSRHFPFI